jgi:hypothetical protein
MILANPTFSGSINISGSLNLNGSPLTATIVPIFESVSPVNVNSTASLQVIEVTGQNFDGSAIGYLKDNNGTRKDPTTSVRNSEILLTLTYSGSDRITSANEPYDVYILNGNGENTYEENVINVDASPSWQTAAGKVGEINANQYLTASINITATDPDSNDTLTYAISGGALPAGMSLITSTGELSGSAQIPLDIGSYNSAGVNYNFTSTVTDGASTRVRSFYITKKWFNDGSTSAQAAEYGSDIVAYQNSIGTFSPGRYWLTGLTSAGNAAQQVYVDSGGWMLFYRHAGTGGSYNSTYEIKGDTLGESAVGIPMSPTMGLTDTGASTTANSRGVGRFSTQFTRALGGNSASNNVIWMICGNNTVYVTDAQWWSTQTSADGYAQTSISYGASYGARRNWTNFTGDTSRPMSTYPGNIFTIPWYEGNGYSGGYDSSWHVATTIYTRQY